MRARMLDWLYVDLNSFFASCEQQARPELRGKAIAIVPLIADTTAVLAASQPAKQRGVKTGVTVGEARRLCPGIVLVLARHEWYVRVHHQMVDAVESCLPVDAVLSIDEVACRLTGSQREESNARGLAELIRRRLRERVGECITASIGIAPNRYLAKVASDLIKPNGLVVLKREQLPQSLYGLKLRDLPGIGAKTEERLWSLGIRSVQALAELTPERASQLWGGVWGARVVRWLHGDPAEWHTRSDQSMSHQHVLGPHYRSWELALPIAQKLLARVALRVRRKDLMARKLMLSVSLQAERSVASGDAVGGWSGTDDISVWERLDSRADPLSLSAALSRLWSRARQGEAPRRVAVTLADLVPNEGAQISLFEDPRRLELTRAMDRINERFGRDALHLGAAHPASGAERRGGDPAPVRIAFRRIPSLDELDGGTGSEEGHRDEVHREDVYQEDVYKDAHVDPRRPPPES